MATHTLPRRFPLHDVAGHAFGKVLLSWGHIPLLAGRKVAHVRLGQPVASHHDGKRHAALTRAEGELKGDHRLSYQPKAETVAHFGQLKGSVCDATGRGGLVAQALPVHKAQRSGVTAGVVRLEL